MVLIWVGYELPPPLPPLLARGRKSNEMIILWDTGIPKWNTKIDIPFLPPLSQRKALIWVDII